MHLDTTGSVEERGECGALKKFFERDHSWTFFFLAAFLRLAFFFFILIRFGDAGFILPPFSDGHGYAAIAHNVLEGRGFSLEEEPPYLPDTKRVPLYPLFLAATFTITDGALWLAALLQTVMSSATALLVYIFTERVAGRRAAFFAGLFAAIQPFNILLSTQILAEAVFTLCLLGVFTLFVWALHSRTYAHFLVGGIVAGIATLVKPVGQYIPFLLIPIIALGQSGIKRLWNPLIYLVGFLIIVSPWIARNNYAAGVPTLSYEANILFSLHLAGYEAFKETGAASRAAEYRTESSPEELLAIKRSEFVARVMSVALHDPAGFSYYLLITTIPFVFGDGFITIVHSLSSDPTIPPWDFSTSASALGHTIGLGILPPWLLLLSIVSKTIWGIVLLGAAFGFVQFFREGGHKRLICFAIAVTVCYFAFAGGPVNSARYRQPVEPLIFLLAGAGLADAWRILEKRRKAFHGLLCAHRNNLHEATN